MYAIPNYTNLYLKDGDGDSWGCSHEKLAHNMFTDEHKKSHENVKVHKTGFFTNPHVSFLGASLDGLVSCD